jgi:hypothetical protein
MEHREAVTIHILPLLYPFGISDSLAFNYLVPTHTIKRVEFVRLLFTERSLTCSSFERKCGIGVDYILFYF